MESIGKLVDALNDAIQVPNRIASQVKQIHRFYNPKENQWTFTLEYRVKVDPKLDGDMQVTNLQPQRESMLEAILKP